MAHGNFVYVWKTQADPYIARRCVLADLVDLAAYIPGGPADPRQKLFFDLLFDKLQWFFRHKIIILQTPEGFEQNSLRISDE